MASISSMIAAFTRPATLGHKAHQFLEALDKKLPENPSEAEYRAAVESTLRLVYPVHPGKKLRPQ
jgi:hypothetical protein